MKKPPFILVLSLLTFILSCTGKHKHLLTQKDNDAIENYLDKNVMKPSFGGEVFNAFEVFEASDSNIYLWAYMQEYYKKDDTLKKGTGFSVPMVLTVEFNNKELKILAHKVPGDGDKYTSDIKSMFPEDIQQRVLDFPGTKDLEKLVKKVVSHKKF